ncbi:hypothetical protein K438DRAFT_300193 [Mycena galopus ATCC 62051]|nr:hypothetical protein K438DRAFT_300193 [Mycena galopus ATCC 62051]
MFVLLTFSHLLVSSLQCVLFPHRPCLSCSLFLAFWSLARALSVLFPCCPCLSCSLFLAFWSLACRACFSPIAHVCLAHFFLPSGLQFVCAFPPLPMLVLPTCSRLLVSSP